MSSDLDKLKELFQGYAASSPHLSRVGCPSSDEIVASFEPRTSRRQKTRIIEHIAHCPLCREEFMMLVERQSREPKAAEPATPSRAGKHRGLRGAGLIRPPNAFWRFAATLLGLTLLVWSLVVVVHQRERWNVLRNSGATIRLLAPKPDRRVSRPPLCRWQAKIVADYYVLELFDGLLLPVWTSGPVRERELRLPSEVFARLVPGQRYYWMVTGYSGPAPTGESQMGRFVVSR